MTGGLTEGQAERLRAWLLAQAAAAEKATEGLPPDSKWWGFHRGHADAYMAAERALRVASVGCAVTRAGTITIAIAEDGSAMLVCSGCGTLRRAMPADVVARVGALAKAHAGLHATAAAKGYEFASVSALLRAAGGLSPEDRS